MIVVPATFLLGSWFSLLLPLGIVLVAWVFVALIVAQRRRGE